MKRILLVTLAILSSQLSYALNPLGFERITHMGHVFARSIVHDKDTGLPLWAEYNEEGGHTKIQVDLQKAYEGSAVSGSNYRSYIKALQNFKEQYDGQVDLYTIDEFKAIAESLTTKDGQPITNWQLSKIDPGTLSVAIPSQEKRLQFDAYQIEKRFFPVDLKTYPTLDEDTQSLLLAKDGEILYKSEQRIGKLSVYFVPKEGEVENTTEYEYTPGYKRLHDYDILDPISGVYIEGPSYMGGAASTNENGFYDLFIMMAPCPGFDYIEDQYSHATLYYANFNPRGAPVLPYYIQRFSYGNICNGLYLLLSGSVASLSGAGQAAELYALVSSIPPNIHTINFPVGINVLAGKSLFVGADISDEPTRYHAEESPMTEYMAPNDYDGDGNIDSAQRGYINEEGIFVADETADTYGVFLSSYARPDGQPSFMRAIDVQKDYRNKGLLENLNKDDLMDTDLLVFRESTGQLITERSGLNTEDFRRSGLIDDTAQDSNGNFSYTIAIRSPEDSFAVRSRRFAFDKWQAESKINPALHSQQSDFLRVGEQLRIVAINRATGYMGTVTTELTGTQIGGDVSVYVPPIVMGPPNLKVWATRRYELNGAQAGSDREKRTISNEGAATNDDYLIEVHTQWLDTNGFPLPAGLKGRGFTGRLVKVSADPATTTDPYNTNVQEFAIDPGTQLQVLKFGEGEAGKYHYHVQVSGQTDAENNDFATGNHTGVLRHRPNKYVPVKVPLFDETITNVNKILQQQNNEDAKGTDAAFNWAYRPELSFSVVDLEVSSIQLTDDEDDTLELVDSTDPVISSADSAVEVFFKLMESEFDRITPLDGEQTFILALGEEEIEISASQDESGAITFTNLEHLAHIKPEDYFSIRLYLNEDSQNVLWDWAFTTLDIDTDSDNNNGYDEPDRDVKEEKNESKDGHPGKVVLLNDGDINKNDVPDFAEFEYIDAKGQQYIKKLVPFVVEIPGHVELETATVLFEYQGSDPLAIEQTPAAGDEDKIIYTAAPGISRLWRVNGDQKRDPQGLKQGGDYVAPDVTYSALQLGFEDHKRVQTFYIEGIRRTEMGAAVTRVYLEYQP
ncbi:hypothetical protein [Bermanella sp. R86510]|uniref:hypothetical protein n=1 Tax=unclassified Bermanella TaxID=2627862 RepID=UPI0037CAF6DE